MSLSVTFESIQPLDQAHVLVVSVTQGAVLSPSALSVDTTLSGQLTRALKTADFKGKPGEILVLTAPCPAWDFVIALGLGDPSQHSAYDYEVIGAKLGSRLNGLAAEAVLVLDDLQGVDMAQAAGSIAHGLKLRLWSFQQYKTKKEPAKPLQDLKLQLADPKAAQEHYDKLSPVRQGVFLTRHVVSLPANVLFPASFAKIAEELEILGLTIQILDRQAMTELGMKALLGVAQGSEHEPQFVIIHWQGSEKSTPPLAFVGKGVTFDSGGLSLKPAKGMEDMKGDMAGAGAVLGLMRALAGRKAKVNAVGIMAMVENMPSGTAQRPGDIVTSMSGKTIEVLNTDAEGRLVLADALWYVQTKHQPKIVIDLATLTGAISVALGGEYGGLFTDDDQLTQQLVTAGAATGEKLWRLPLHETFDRDIDSDVADVRNISISGQAGSSTAAHFLKRFIHNDVTWAHLDIAGVASAKKSAGVWQKGATGFGVRLLDEWVRRYHEPA